MLFGMVLIMFSNLGSLEANACLNGASEEVFLCFGALFLKNVTDREENGRFEG